MNLLFCTHDFDSGGSARSLSILVNHLASRHRIVILSMKQPNGKKSMLTQYSRLGVRVHVFLWGWLPLWYRGMTKDISVMMQVSQRMVESIPSVQPLFADKDAICFNAYPAVSLAQIMPAGIPKYLLAREVVDENSPLLERIIPFLQSTIRKAAAIGPVESKQLEKFGIPHKIVYNTCSHKPEYKAMPAFPPFHFGFFGQMLVSKGIDKLFAVCAKQAEAMRKARVKIHIFGETYDSKALLDDAIQKLNLQDLIIQEGWVDNVEENMAKMHCIVRPDADGSPWGRDIIEAMSMGRPVIATGTEDVFVKNGTTGYLVPTDEPRKIAKAILDLAASPDRLVMMGLNAFKFAESNFDPNRNTAEIEKMLSGEDA